MISVILPTYREADNLQQLIPQLQQDPWVREIIVSDGGSPDQTAEIARSLGAQVVEGPAGRGAQLNRGARMARQDWLYFLHADTRPPPQFGAAIVQCDGQAGTFRARFDCPGLRPAHLRKAADALARHPVVIGPSLDGGYYLLGLQKPAPGIFQGIDWSTPQVLAQTLAKLDQPPYLLPELRDLDDLADWQAARLP